MSETNFAVYGSVVTGETIGHVGSIHPFTGIGIVGVVDNPLLTSTITLSNPAAGALRLGAFNLLSLTALGNGTYELSAGDRLAEDSALNSLVFIPSASGATSFDLTVTDETTGQSATLTSGVVTIDPGPTITPLANGPVSGGQATPVATVTPGLPGDTLSLTQTAVSGGGGVKLQLVNGVYQVIDTPPAHLSGPALSQVTYRVTDQYNDAASGTAIIGGAGNHSLSASGDTTVILGAGNNTVNLSGTDNTVALSGGNGTIVGGTDDTIRLDGNGTLAVSGTGEMVFLGAGNDTVIDQGQSLQLTIGPNAGNDVVANFAADLAHGVIDLVGGVGGYSSAAQAYAALTSDGHGGVILPLGHAAQLDITGVAANQLSAGNFHIG